MLPNSIREQLVSALQTDLVGPASPDEVLPQSPARWYLTGFLVPLDAAEEQRVEADAEDEVDEQPTVQGLDESQTPEPVAARQRYLPSSMGLSVLVPAAARELVVAVRWGDYVPLAESPASESAGPGGDKSAPKEKDAALSKTQRAIHWQRRERQERVSLAIPGSTQQPQEVVVPHSEGLVVALSVRPVTADVQDGGLPAGTRSVSVFLVNRRRPMPDEIRDAAFVFQAELEVQADQPFVARPNLRSLESDDWDERVADLQYRDACEFAVGHGVSCQLRVASCKLQVPSSERESQWGELSTCNSQLATCNSQLATHSVHTCWLPQSDVERVAPTKINGVALRMDELSELADGAAAQARLGAFVSQYREWIESQVGKVPASPSRRKETGEQLLDRARQAADRIERGIGLLNDPIYLEAFRIANRVMATAARQRFGVMKGRPVESIRPEWHPFQLAFLLMNLDGIANPTSYDREIVDLLFFPTGGGKTEAYLGLAAFTLVLRRLRNPGIASAGVSVLMRYTLRLLTLDQLGRAATLICALELERQKDVDKLGPWPFEIGLWVGRAATPNRMGSKGDNDRESARAKTIAYQNDDRKPSPIPLENCPWCGAKFTKNSFRLVPGPDHPTDLRVGCVNRDCAFTRGQYLPILAVDEPIYRRLPCFLIATVDKFAAMPWTGDVGAFFGRVFRHDKEGFYGPCESTRGNLLPVDRLLPPDLVIQDELHLISGPLGTVAGLYETALDELCSQTIGDHKVRPKIVASTATVRQAEQQIRALFNHRYVDVFPPPGPDRRDSFFARTHSTEESHARRYLGVAAQGRSPKVIMLRVYLALLAAAQRWYEQAKPAAGQLNPADPYMTLLGYFNSLRELGGARRLIEDEVRNRLAGYGSRKRVGETNGVFVSREIDYEPVELTSRVNTAAVADAKRRLEQPFDAKGRVDVAIATNMISVGLDITRLGLMVVFGQPKTSAEYIQATSRVGRDHERPGLVVTLLNIHRPRDRSHYERFTAYHESFYRSVEATSVTPFSPRALDRALAGTLVALARQGHPPMTAPLNASQILQERLPLDYVVETLANRALQSTNLSAADAQTLGQRVRERAKDLLDEWSKIAMEQTAVGAPLIYNSIEGGSGRALLHDFLDPELKELPPRFRKFRANRSMRDVEPNVNLWLRTMDGEELEE